MNSILDKFVFEAAIKEAVFHAAAVIVTDLTTGVVLYVSPPVATMFGYTEDEILGEHVEILVPADVRETHVKHRQRYADAPRSRPMGSGMVLRGQHKDGTEFPIQVALQPSQVMHRPVVVAIVLDLTEPVKTASMIQNAGESGILKHG